MGVIQQQGIKSTVITYAGIFIGFLSLLVIQPQFLNPEIIGLTRILYSFSFLVSTIVPLSIVNITTRFFPRFRASEKKTPWVFWFHVGLACMWKLTHPAHTLDFQKLFHLYLY